MKKIFFVICIALLIFSNINAQLLSGDTDRETQEFYFLQGDKALNLRVGFSMLQILLLAYFKQTDQVTQVLLFSLPMNMVY